MTEMRTLNRLRSVWQGVTHFLATHMLIGIGGLLFLLLAIFLIYPISAVLVKSVTGPEGFTLEYYEEFLSYSYYYRSFFNSLLLGVMTTSVCLSVASCIAYMTTRGPRCLRTPLKLITLLPLVAPSFIFALSLIILFGHNGIITRALDLSWSIYGFTGCVIAQSLAFLPIAYIMIENNLSSLNPNLEDSAANLGASEGKILRSITLPLLTPGFLKAGLIVFVLAIAEFGNVALLSGRTPFLAPDTYLAVVGEADFNMASVLSVFLILPCVVIFILQNYLIKGRSYTTVGGKPVAAEPRYITPTILIPMLAISFIMCGLILLTFGVVGVGAFTKVVGIDNTFILSNILNVDSNDALINSLKVSLLAGLFGAIMGVLLAYVIVRGKFRGRAALEGMGLSGFVLPGTIVGVGYILVFNRSSLRLTGTMIILVINCAFRFLAVGIEAGINKLQQLSIEIEEASQNLGASTMTTFRRVVLPLIFPAFMYGFMFEFIVSMKSLSAVVFLISPGFCLVSVYIFLAAGEGRIGFACATTLKLVAVVAVSLGIIQYLSKWTGLGVTRKA